MQKEISDIRKMKGCSTMTKTQLIEKAAAKAQVSKKEVAKVYDALYAAFVEGLAEGGVQLAGVGTFAVKTRAARTGINPRTGASIQIKASKYVSFSAAKAIKEKVN